MGRITFQKHQKEMKRLEKQRLKAERRAQKKLAKNLENEAEGDSIGSLQVRAVERIARGLF